MPIGTVLPPAEHPDEEPLICVQLNRSWISYLIGALAPLKYPEYWSGTLEENRQARRDTNNLIFMLMQSVECGDDPMAVNYCCVDRHIIKRVNPVTLQVEISIDGGETWTPDPKGLDTIVTELPPPVPNGTAADKCHAAGNGYGHIQDMIEVIHQQKQDDVTLSEMIVAVATALFSLIAFWLSAGAAALAIPALFEAIFAAIVGVRQMDLTAYDAYWSESERHKILCALYCTIG